MAGTPCVLDTCSALNLFASGRPAEIARASGVRFMVLPEVINEASGILGGLDDDGNLTRMAIDWNVLLGSGLAIETPLPPEALPTLISFAALLTDTDAKCASLAQHMRIGLVTDDGKIRRVFVQAGSGLPLHSTVSLLRTAAQSLELDQPTIKGIFHRIRKHARFEPPRSDPDYGWYVKQTKA